MKNKSSFKVKKAGVKDAGYIHGMVKKYSREVDLVIRNLPEIYGRIRDYFIIEGKSRPVGFIALRIYWEDLAEIRSFVVDKNYRGLGLGNRLFNAAMREARGMGIKKVFVLTGIPDYFLGKGFKIISKKKLPHKIWEDCLNCPKFPDCDETALITRLKQK